MKVLGLTRGRYLDFDGRIPTVSLKSGLIKTAQRVTARI